MNTTKAAILAAALLGSSVLATDADAHRRHRHHHHHGNIGIWFGAPVYYPRYHYYPRYYYPPAVIAPAPAYYPPPTYIEQSAPASGSTSYWYYCRDSQAYYPYVQQCASPWQQVVPNSAPPS
ncbi:MAG TPA: hypothetical protein VED01_01050 [Burkholderiales bacterium]|nr:hypothetical protein [Burkholderiales bacterium]